VSACTVIIPTRDRPDLLREAVDSALAQTAPSTEVVVVDDGSRPPVGLDADSRLRVVRHLHPRGVSAARNLGISLATTRYVTFLDDDDLQRPHLVETSLAALAQPDAPSPVAVVSGLAVVDEAGRTERVRVPPSLRARGAHFSLEPNDPGRSYFTKQTLVAPRAVLLSIGGFDERLPSRVVTDLFWRLNPVCSIVGVEEVTYERRRHAGPRLSRDRRFQQRSFRQLVSKHGDVLRAHPKGYAHLLTEHARHSLRAGQPLSAVTATTRAASLAPGHTLRIVSGSLRSRSRRFRSGHWPC
jgi:glycosyltransferase involved in cell wall biosynthesis